MSAPVQLGPFTLEAKIGSGGMAEVWRGRDAARDQLVAVKVIKASGAVDPETREQFRREVEAIARLQHPGIITIYDYGVIDREAAVASDGALSARSPFLAMEYADEGELDPETHVRGWTDLADLLFEILGALAFAHARDIIHRDLKPANVLLVGGGDHRFKLSDFGIAHAVDPHDNPSARDIDTAASGTPHFMPPEQLRGQWRDFGPWSDLYALGCVTYLLVTGSVPFPGDSLFEISRCHLDEKPPSIEPRFAVPDGLVEWIHRLMQKNPNYRYRHAADAARALAELAPPGISPHARRWSTGDDASGSTDRQMGAVRLAGENGTDDAESDRESPDAPIGPDAETTRLDESDAPRAGGDDGDSEPNTANTATTEQLDPDLGFADTRAATAPGGPGPAAPEDSPFGIDPDEELPADPPVALPDEPPSPGPWDSHSPPSTRLFSLRDLPLIDREKGRRQLWNGLRDAMAGDGPRGYFLRGPDGLGKSKLAEWFTRAADECGCATILRADHGAFRGPTTGLARMLEVFFTVWDLERPAMYRRIRRRLADIYRRCERDVVPRYIEDDARALTELIRPRTGRTDSGADGSQFTFSSLNERNAVVGRFVSHLASTRPVVLHLEDVHWGPETLSFVEHLIDETEAAAPVVVVMTARKANLDDRPEIARRIETLIERERIADLAIGQLDEQSHRRLVRDVLKLDDPLAGRVHDRTGGDPLFAVQLVHEWVDRGDLVPGESGFQPRPEAHLTVPDSADAFWKRRLSRFIPILQQNAGDDALEALYRAAALGENINTREWEALCEEADLQNYHEVLNTLARFGLANRRRDSWSFAFGQFHSAIEMHAELDDRWQDCHAACAAMLDRRYGDKNPQARRRRALHLLAAGRNEAALAPLLRAARRAMRGGQYNDAEYLLDRRLEAIDRLDLPDTDRRRLETWIVAGRMHKLAGHTKRAASYIERALPQLRSIDWLEGLGRAIGVRATLLTDDGEFDDAYACTVEAEGYLRDAGKVDDALADVLRTRGGILYYQAKLDEADECFRQAAELFAASNDLSKRAQCLNFRATIAIADGDLDRAEREAEDALETARLLRNPDLEADCLNNLADLARARSQVDEARQRYRQAAILWKRSGSRDFLTAELNVALCDVAADDPASIREILPAVDRDVTDHGIRFYRPFVDLLAGFCAADAENWSEWDDRVDSAVETTEAMELVDRDLGWLAEHVGDRAAAAGAGSRARRAWALAFQQYDEVGDADRADALRQKLTDEPSTNRGEPR